jgi:sugar/nucleoside kinase (ribokinase family)
MVLYTFELAKAAALCHGAGRMISMTLSDSFMVDRHRGALLGFMESQVDLVFANENEITALFETDDFDAAVNQIRGQVKLAAVTCGSKGSVIVRGDETVTIPAYPVDQVVDTTGAGARPNFLSTMSRTSKPLRSRVLRNPTRP